MLQSNFIKVNLPVHSSFGEETTVPVGLSKATRSTHGRVTNSHSAEMIWLCNYLKAGFREMKRYNGLKAVC